MAKKMKGTNSKVEEANQRKAAAKAAKDQQAMKDLERKAEEEWSIGSNKRGQRKAEEEERKRREADEKAAKKKELEQMEEQMLGNVKAKVKKTKKQKDMDRPWEAALAPVVKKNNRGTKAPPVSTESMRKAAAEAKAAEEARLAKKGIVTQDMLMKNDNREKSTEPGSTIDDALSALSSKDPELDRHPEKRAKAAYKEFEERMMPQLKEDFPRLKLSQYKEKLRDMWRKSPDNPLNQERKNYNSK